MFMEVSRSGALCLTYIPAWAWRGIGTSAGNVVDMTRGFFLLKFILRIDQSFP